MLFRQATGWLGWSPQQAMTTRIPLILLALEGKVDFIRSTHPLGAGKSEETPVEPQQNPHLWDKFQHFFSTNEARKGL